MKKSVILHQIPVMKNSVLILLLIVLSSFQVSVMSITDMHVMKAAEGQLGVFTGKIPPGEASSYGFRQEDDMELLAIEKPYRTIEFSKDFYENPIGDDKNYIVINNEWRAPVSSKGVNRVMLVVTGSSSNFRAVSMGDTLLARELQPLSRGLNDSDEYYLLRIPALSADFFVHEANFSFADAEFIPLSSAKKEIKALSKDRKDAYSLNEVQQFVKDEYLVHKKKEDEKPLPKRKK